MIEHESIRGEVVQLLGADVSGHSIDHVDRVHDLSLEFAKKEGADPEVVSLIARLHDVDDYKIFGQEYADNLINARRILDTYRVQQTMSQQVLRAISMMGYNKSLEGIRPDTLAGQIVSDADMNDAIGSQGLIRVFDYNASKRRPFFVKTIPPITETFTAEQYRAGTNDHAVQHFFDKLLLIQNIMMTESGREEGQKRTDVMVNFLSELFREEGASDWQRYLDEFINRAT